MEMRDPASAIATLVVAFGAAWGLAMCGAEPSVEYQIAASESRSVTLGEGPDAYAGIPPDSHLLALDKQALEQAYLQRLVRLFDVYLTSTGATDATNFINGLRIARKGYNNASAQILRREREVEEYLRQRQPPNMDQKPQEQK
jgi:hypothetical protein